MRDVRHLHRAALADASELVARIRPADADRPTPCTGWDLQTLLAHMVGQHVGFATAVRHGDAPASAYEPIAFDLDTWRDSVTLLLDAFAAADLAAEVVEIELHPTQPLPVGVLIGAQLLDTAVHVWDVACSLGVEYTPSRETVDAVLETALRIPDGAGRDAPGAAFARGVRVDDATPWHRCLALLGRQPDAHGR